MSTLGDAMKEAMKRRLEKQPQQTDAQKLESAKRAKEALGYGAAQNANTKRDLTD